MQRLTPRVLVAPFISLIALSGCLFDFRQFEGPPTPGDFGPVLDADRDDAVDSDVGPDVADGEPQPNPDANIVVGGQIGESCAVDPDCEGGRCWAGYCSQGCAVNGDCPSSTFCATVEGEGLCVLACDESRGCAGGARDDLACADLRANDESGVGAACLPDGDADAVADLVDNCPADPNATQRDLDLDGTGDACDGEPRCIDGHVDGVITYGPAAYGASSPAVPGYANDWFLIAGGDAAEGLSNTALLVDRREGSVSPITLPYPARSFAAAPIGPDEFLLSPGAYGSDGQFGRFVHVSRDGTTRLGDAFEVEGGTGVVHDPIFAVGPDGTLWMHAYRGSASSGVTAWRLYRHDAGRGVFVETPGGNDGVRSQWYVATDAVGRIFFYSTMIDPLLQQGRIVTIEPGATGGSSRLVSYPTAAGLPFDPFLVPATGGEFFLYERTTGTAFRFDGTTVGEAVPTLAVADELSEKRWMSHATGPGFTIVGHQVNDPSMIEARSYSLACLPDIAQVDIDADGVPDPSDLCPRLEVPSVTDADFDEIGDACDVDADGDGLRDDSEMVAGLDTDNDGLTNDVDPDDDADGIPDVRDRYPLDTDNDGVPNAFDEDDDDDGFVDTEENALGSDATDPLSFPGSGSLAWVAGGKVWVASFEDVGAATTLTAVGQVEPELPRFDDAGTNLLALAGAPGTATKVQLLAIAGGGVEYEVGAPLYGADPVQSQDGLVRAIVSMDSIQQPGAAMVAFFDPFGGVTSPVTELLTDLGPPDHTAGRVAFLGAPPGCATCRSAYVVPLFDGSPRIVAANVSNPVSVRYNGASFTLVADASDRAGKSVWIAAEGDATENNPPLVTDVFSVVGSSDGHLVVSAADENGSALWFFNGARNRWHRLAGLPEPARDIDWTR